MRYATTIDARAALRPGAVQVSGSRSSGGRRMAFVGLLLVVCSCGYADGSDPTHKINGAVHVEAGKAPGSAETVNGSIDIDPNATVTAVATVNGSIHVGAHATAKSVKAVNGAITLDAGAHVTGPVESVNGELKFGDAADVGGTVKNVSGRIELQNAHVAGGITTVAGEVSVLGSSLVEGGILVHRPGGGIISIGGATPRIVVGPGATVRGDLRFERDVRLFVSDKATIGTVTGAVAVTYSGDTPPM